MGKDIPWVSWNKRQVDTRIPPPGKGNSYKYAHSLLPTCLGWIEMIGNEGDL